MPKESDDQILKDLNLSQKEAVLHLKGPLLILAGPGSGKTKTITHKIAYLIAQGIKPDYILALTFTNKAAEEMRQRIFNLLKKTANLDGIKGLTIGTFHSFGTMILRHSGSFQGRNKYFVIYDQNDSLALIKEAFKASDVSKEDYSLQAIHNAILKAKVNLLTPQEFSQNIQSHLDEIIYKIYDIYERLLKQNNAYDFEDLIMKTIQYFISHPEALQFWQDKYQYILVDEYQDTNYSQYFLVKMLVQKHQNLTVVGDEDQSIYSFRMADYRNILNFEKDFPGAKVIELGQNYRSTKTIVEASSHLINNNQFRMKKNLWTNKKAGEAIFLREFENEKEEAAQIVWNIRKLISEENFQSNEIAILYRTNAQSRALEEAFLREGLPYNLIGDVNFYQRKEVKDIVAYLKILHNPVDSLSLKRIINVPPRGIGEKTASLILLYGENLMNEPQTLKEKLPLRIYKKISTLLTILNDLKTFKKKLPLRDLITQVIKITGYEDFLKRDLEQGGYRLENIQELISLAKDFKDYPQEEQLQKFLEKVSLYSEDDKLNLSKDGPHLMTLHIAKGLEFKIVFLVGMEEGILPHFKAFEEPYGIEEERRLCYVGLTRAKERIYLSFAKKRTLYGKTQFSLPSRFLQEIPEHLLQINKIDNISKSFIDF